MAPTLLKLAIDLTQQKSTIQNINGSVFLGMALFGLLGAVVAGVWGEKNLRKVFYLGLGLPSLLTVANSQATAPPARQSAAVPFAPIRVFAATNPVNGRTLKVVLPANVTAALPQAVFTTGEGDHLAAVGDTPIAVPSTAHSVRIRSEIGTSNTVVLPQFPNASFALTITAAKNYWYGFQYAIGIHADPYTLSATLASSGGATSTLVAKRPIALALGPTTGLFVLQGDGAVLTLGDGKLAQFAAVPESCVAGDLTVAKFLGTPRAFVTGITRIGSAGCLIPLNDDASKVVVTLPIGSGSLAGVAADPGTGTVYAAAAHERQIYAWNITSTSLTGRRVAAHVSGAASLGAMAIDTSTQQLFVADPQGQNVYRVTLGKHPDATKILAAHHPISALALDEARHILYVGGGNKLTAMGTDGVGQPQLIATDLKNISGVAVDNDHRVWISVEGGTIQKIAH